MENSKIEWTGTPRQDGSVAPGMKFAIYLASRYSRRDELRGYADQLQARGYVVTSRWIHGSHEIAVRGSEEAEFSERERFAKEDMEDLQNADVVISFTEAARSNHSRGGRHVEFGMAVAYGKRCVVIGHRENVFNCLPCVQFFRSWEAFVAHLDGERGVRA